MISIRKLDKSYNEAMLEILALSPMKTPALELYFDKGPDIFKLSELWSHDHVFYGIFFKEELVGFGKHLKYIGYMQGNEYPISYFGDYCIKPGYRGRGLFKKLGEYMIQKCLKYDHIGVSIVLEGNKPAQVYFENEGKSFSGLPDFHIFSSILTRSILITRKKKRGTEYRIIRANHSHKEQIVHMLSEKREQRSLAPVFNSREFDKKISGEYGFEISDYYLAYQGEDLLGLVAAWDMKKIKRTRVINYRKHFYVIYYLYKGIGKLLNYPKMPAIGEDLKEVYLTDVVIQKNDPEVLRALVIEIYNNYYTNGYNLMHFGSYKEDPLFKAFDIFSYTSLYSRIYLSPPRNGELKNISLDATSTRPHLDISLI